MTDRLRVVGIPERNLTDRVYLFRGVRPHERVVLDGGALHSVVPDQPEPVTGCGQLVAESRISPAYQLPGHPLCPHTECFGDLT